MLCPLMVCPIDGRESYGRGLGKAMRGTGGTRSCVLDRHLLQHHILVRTILAILRDSSDLYRDVLPLHNFAKNRVFAGQPRGRYGRNEELGSIRIRPGIRHRQFARLVEFMRRSLGLVLELISGSTHARTLRISALNHEVGDDSVKNRSIVEAIL